MREQLATLPDRYHSTHFDAMYVVGGTPRQILNAHRKKQGVKGDVHGYEAPADEIKALSKAFDIDTMIASRDGLRKGALEELIADTRAEMQGAFAHDVLEGELKIA